METTKRIHKSEWTGAPLAMPKGEIVARLRSKCYRPCTICRHTGISRNVLDRILKRGLMHKGFHRTWVLLGEWFKDPRDLHGEFNV